MLPTQQLLTPLSLVVADAPGDRMELCRMFAAAVVNQNFRHLLLTDPELALQNGYQGETFGLANDERSLLLSIRADSLADLASQLLRTLERQIFSGSIYSAQHLAMLES